MEKGALGSKFTDRTNPLEWQANLMNKVQGTRRLGANELGDPLDEQATAARRDREKRANNYA